jgi:hypothetical protein
MAAAMHREDDRTIAAGFGVMRLHATRDNEPGSPYDGHQLLLLFPGGPALWLGQIFVRAHQQCVK